MKEIKRTYVVCDEHTLGILYNDELETIEILHSSILRGATFEVLPESKMRSLYKNVRLAELADFDTYRCVPPPNFTKIQIDVDIRI